MMKNDEIDYLKLLRDQVAWASLDSPTKNKRQNRIEKKRK